MKKLLQQLLRELRKSNELKEMTLEVMKAQKKIDLDALKLQVEIHEYNKQNGQLGEAVVPVEAYTEFKMCEDCDGKFVENNGYLNVSAMCSSCKANILKQDVYKNER